MSEDFDVVCNRTAREHLSIVGPEVMLLESVDGLIEAACDGLMVKLGHGCSCDPSQTHEYAAVCFRMALDELRRPTWICGCGTVNGVNLAVCRVCGRKDGSL